MKNLIPIQLLLFAILGLISKTGSAQMTFRVTAITGTSESSCDFGVNDEAVWGAKVGFQDKFKLFNGEGNSCPPINVNEDGPQLIYEETLPCANQFTKLELCLLAADADFKLFGCGEVTEQNVDCSFQRCEEISFDRCFREDCSVSLEYPMEARNPVVNTKGVKFLVERSGNCVTKQPTKAPSKQPTGFPTPRPTNPTPFPTFGCAGTFEQCGGGPGYIGPQCCIAGHTCEENQSGRLTCQISGAQAEDEGTTLTSFLAIGGIGVCCIALVTSRLFFGGKPKQELQTTFRATNVMFEDPNAEQQNVPKAPPPPQQSVNVPSEFLDSFSKPQRRPSYDDVSV